MTKCTGMKQASMQPCPCVPTSCNASVRAANANESLFGQVRYGLPMPQTLPDPAKTPNQLEMMKCHICVMNEATSKLTSVSVGNALCLPPMENPSSEFAEAACSHSAENRKNHTTPGAEELPRETGASFHRATARIRGPSSGGSVSPL